MSYKNELEKLREELNSAISCLNNTIDLTDESIVDLSQQLDTFVVIQQRSIEKRREKLIE